MLLSLPNGPVPRDGCGARIRRGLFFASLLPARVSCFPPLTSEICPGAAAGARGRAGLRSPVPAPSHGPAVCGGALSRQRIHLLSYYRTRVPGEGQRGREPRGRGATSSELGSGPGGVGQGRAAPGTGQPPPGPAALSSGCGGSGPGRFVPPEPPARLPRSHRRVSVPASRPRINNK